MERKTEAIELYKSKYGRAPEEDGFYVMDVYEKQHAFLYAKSSDVIRSYKTQQNIIRWLLMWALWPLAASMVLFLLFFASYQDVLHPACVTVGTFFVSWSILLLCLCFIGAQTTRDISIGKNITYLNY